MRYLCTTGAICACALRGISAGASSELASTDHDSSVQTAFLKIWVNMVVSLFQSGQVKGSQVAGVNDSVMQLMPLSVPEVQLKDALAANEFVLWH
jgi:hypothetical protein